jgi:hypothetical protein
MSKIFISHSSINNASALAIAQWLEDNGWKEYFLDITPAQGLSPGERWQEALKKAADRCEIVLFLISPAWRNSKWCLAEFFLAKQLGKRLFGVLIQPTPINPLFMAKKEQSSLYIMIPLSLKQPSPLPIQAWRSLNGASRKLA